MGRKILFSSILGLFVLAFLGGSISIFGMYWYNKVSKSRVSYQPHKRFEALFWPNTKRSFMPEKNKEHGVTYKEVSYEVNSHGFRGKEFSLEPPEGTLRILALGGSSTANVRAQVTWSEHLERNLREAGYSVEVLNLGIPGWNLQHIRSFFLQAGAYLNADIALIYEGYNSFHRYEWPVNEAFTRYLTKKYFTQDDLWLIPFYDPNLSLAQKISTGFFYGVEQGFLGLKDRLGLKKKNQEVGGDERKELARAQRQFRLEDFDQSSEKEQVSDALWETLVVAKRRKILPVVVAQATLLVPNPNALQVARTRNLVKSHSRLNHHEVGVLMDKIEGMKKEVAQGEGVPFIDFREKMNGRTDLLVDQIHMADPGTEVFGRELARALLNDPQVRRRLGSRSTVSSRD